MKHIASSILLMMIGSLGFSQVTNYNVTFEAGTTLGVWNYFENGNLTRQVLQA